MFPSHDRVLWTIVSGSWSSNTTTDDDALIKSVTTNPDGEPNNRFELNITNSGEGVVRVYPSYGAGAKYYLEIDFDNTCSSLKLFSDSGQLGNTLSTSDFAGGDTISVCVSIRENDDGNHDFTAVVTIGADIHELHHEITGTVDGLGVAVGTGTLVSTPTVTFGSYVWTKSKDDEDTACKPCDPENCNQLITETAWLDLTFVWIVTGKHMNQKLL